MTLRDRIRAADALQNARGFKIVASAVLAALVLAAFGGYALFIVGDRPVPAQVFAERIGEQAADSPQAKLVAEILSRGGDLPGTAAAAAVLLGVGLIVIWIGLGITYAAVLVPALAAGLALGLSEDTEPYGRFVMAVAALAAAFSALLRASAILVSGHHPVLAVARNVLAEAVRMKISLVFIIAMMVGLATLPGLLDDAQPLRFRVQSFLQWSTGGVFWLVALLTLLFGVATVSGEQRDKIIWQTMTKPVAAWQYLLGKWIGVAGLAAMLMAVATAGTFLFTEYLRNQPANGETTPFIADVARTGGRTISEDRFILETRVLAARRSAPFDYPEQLSFESEAFLEAVATSIDRSLRVNPEFDTPPEQVAEELMDAARSAFRAVPPGGFGEYVFSGLESARARGEPLTLTYRINAEGNRPDVTYDVSFLFTDGSSVVRETGLDFEHDLAVDPALIAEDGTLAVRIYNGAFVQTARGVAVRPNRRDMSFPETGLEISYPAGSYRLNYARAATALWFKLAFLAAVAVFAGSFLSFPVATLTALGVFGLAEISGFLGDARSTIGFTDNQNNVQLHKLVGTSAAIAVNYVFGLYSDLNPTARLVDGRLLPWSLLAGGAGILAAATAAFFGLGVFALKRRELATYSGQ